MSKRRESKTAQPAAPKAVRKPAPVVKAPLMYVGPTIRAVAVQNTTYTEVPESAKKAMADCPLLANLFVDVRRYPDVERQISKRSGALFVAFEAALKYKESHKK